MSVTPADQQQSSPPARPTRRRFLQNGTAATAVTFFPVICRHVRGANERLNIAAIGAGGKGAVDIGYCGGENVVALADVDPKRASPSLRRFPKAAVFKDYRRMLETVKQIDAVTVSTPDHHHAVAASIAMQLGKHVYCQKPLTHSIYEARVLTQLAQRTGVVTQMGNQGHSQNESRRLVELIKGGAIGKVKEVHVWTDRPIWPQGLARPTDKPAIPNGLDWDLWLGPAQQRPYHSAYLPFKWRGWYDFGTGALGDMGCHNMDLAMWALDLRDPVAVEARTSEAFAETYPKWSIVDYHFGARGKLPACTMTWYDGKKRPSAKLIGDRRLPTNGSIFIGDKDTLFVPSYWGKGKYMSGRSMNDFKDIPVTLPRSAGNDNDRSHHLEWINACKGNGKTLSNFAYAGPMTEAVLLGCVAIRAQKKILWDAKKLSVTNDANANRYVRDEYRKGWGLGATLT